MSTKTFKDIDQLRQLQVKTLNECVNLAIEYKGDGRKGITLAPSDIPALALAEMQAAGFDAEMAVEGDANDHFSLAVHHLTRGLEEQARATAEAREQAELEALALVFLRIAQDHNNVPLTESWEGFLDAGTKLLYVKTAQKARELAQEGK